MNVQRLGAFSHVLCVGVVLMIFSPFRVQEIYTRRLCPQLGSTKSMKSRLSNSECERESHKIHNSAKWKTFEHRSRHPDIDPTPSSWAELEPKQKKSINTTNSKTQKEEHFHIKQTATRAPTEKNEATNHLEHGCSRLTVVQHGNVWKSV